MLSLPYVYGVYVKAFINMLFYLFIFLYFCQKDFFLFRNYNGKLKFILTYCNILFFYSFAIIISIGSCFPHFFYELRLQIERTIACITLNIMFAYWSTFSCLHSIVSIFVKKMYLYIDIKINAYIYLTTDRQNRKKR